ncbi:hypothetical protein CWI69_06915 [Pseudidiomarina halophila]|uniref:diguanylate cyclase n=1 Tax=Pseudidiomarina halophila TaxID=1449799 RepID=A0A432XVL4_9GAMM|nr:hypothetical protein CWI69_06915 [Pseudidiomarina halophila]
MRAQILAGFVVPIVIVAILSWIVSVNMENVRQLSDQSERLVNEVQVRAEVLRTVIDAETGERGYVITGNEEFLEPYENAKRQFARLAAEWRSLAITGGFNPELERMEQLFERWLNNVAEPAIAARALVPGRQFSHSFNAYYHLNRLQEFLREEGMLESVRLENEFYQAARMKALGQSSDAERNSGFLPIVVPSEQLDQLVGELPATGASTELNKTISALVQRLERQWREIALDYREAENVSAELVASGQGKQLVDEMRDIIRAAIAEKEVRYAAVNAEVNERMQLLERLSMYLPVVGVGLGLAILLFMQMGVISSIEKLRVTARRIEAGDLSARVRESRSDELGVLAGDFNRMADQLELADKESTVLAGFQSMLVSSNTEDETYGATARALAKLLPPGAGALYLMAPSRDFAELAISWGFDDEPSLRFHPENCRALRLGRTYKASKESTELFCAHADQQTLEYSVCIPLITRDEVLGTLFLAGTSSSHRPLEDHQITLAKTVAERLSLALSNIRLTEKLRRESVRDPLTGLFNRRYLEETMEREMQRVARAGKPLSLITLDVDHFKRFNDTFGHEAGDRVLEELAEQMTNIARAGDVVCRFGGEEFMIIMPEAGTDTAGERAEELRRRIEMLDLHYGGTSLGHVTISLGVATYPKHAAKKEELIRLADNALYEAKKRGRNQVAIHS